MKKLPEVEAAKILMTEAMMWSVMKWLREKKRVRKTADEANAALDRLRDELKQRWPDRVKGAYEALAMQPVGPNHAEPTQRKESSAGTDAEAALIARKMKEADDEAHGARMSAEKAFDEAERLLSTSRAREGCRKAIRSWELHESAIRKSEAIVG
jgi:hypothetical protein